MEFLQIKVTIASGIRLEPLQIYQVFFFPEVKSELCDNFTILKGTVDNLTWM